MRNTQFTAAMADARARGIKRITRRLNTQLKPGVVTYHGEALIRSGPNAGYNDPSGKAFQEGLVVYRRDHLLVPSREQWKWQRPGLPGRFCPQRCARLFSLVRAVRYEHLQLITEEEAKLEGIERGPCAGWLDPSDEETAEYATARIAFFRLWDKINSDHRTIDNPMVFVVDLGLPLTTARAAELGAMKTPEERLVVQDEAEYIADQIAQVSK